MTSSPLDQAISLLSAHGDHDYDRRSSTLCKFLLSGNEDPVVDSVLSMLGFTQSPVQRSFWNISGTTLATILSTYVASGTSSLFHSLERLQVSTRSDENSIFVRDVLSKDENPPFSHYHESEEPMIDFKEMAECVLSLLKGPAIEEALALEILESVVKAASMTPAMKFRHSGRCLLYEREHSTVAPGTSFLYPLIQFALAKRETFYDCFRPTTRLLLWRLQQNLLWDDLSTILQKISQRPLLPLIHELRHVQGWYNLILGLAYGPDIYLKARMTLNGWILVNGASCLFELKEGVCAAVRDVLEHPSSWGLDLESGASLPPMSAFYHVTLQPSIQILNRLPTLQGLRELLDLIMRVGSLDTTDSQLEDSSSIELANRSMNFTEKDLYSPDSLWMLLLEFPTWIQFASFFLFSRSDTLLEEHDGIAQIREICDEKNIMGSRHCEIAAMYISWCFSPHDNKVRDLVMRMLFQTVEQWHKIRAKEGKNYNEVPLRLKRRRLMRMVDKGDKTKTEVGGEEFLRDSSEISFFVNEVEHWLVSFRDSCHLLDTYSSVGSQHSRMESNGTYPAKEKLLDEAKECSLNHSSCTKMSSFFSTFPLVALSCSAQLQNDATINIILHFVMSGYGCLFSDVNGIRIIGPQQNVSCREPSHRTEDYRDSCIYPFCQSFSHHASSGIASLGVAQVFKFLEALDTINGLITVECIDGFKEMVVNQLMICIRCWSKQVTTAQCVTVLNDLRCRGSLWVNGSKLQNETLRAFHQVLQDLDAVIISSSAVNV